MTTDAEEKPTRTSDLLLQLAQRVDTPRVSIRYLVDALGERGLGVLIAVFALPNILPSVVPFGNVPFGILVMLFSLHLVIGVRHLMLPDVIGRRTIGSDTFRSWAPRLARALSWFERLLKPTLPSITHPGPERIIGLIAMLLALVSAIPLPLVHNLPAVALTLIGLGLIERDGRAILAGIAIGIAGVVLLVVLLLGVYTGVAYLTGLR